MRNTLWMRISAPVPSKSPCDPSIQRQRPASAFPCMDNVFISPKTCPGLKNTPRRKTLSFVHCCISQATAKSLSIPIMSLFPRRIAFQKRKTSPSRHRSCCPAYGSGLIPGLTVPFMSWTVIRKAGSSVFLSWRMKTTLMKCSDSRMCRPHTSAAHSVSILLWNKGTIPSVFPAWKQPGSALPRGLAASFFIRIP